jgi:hypothetical protein
MDRSPSEAQHSDKTINRITSGDRCRVRAGLSTKQVSMGKRFWQSYGGSSHKKPWKQDFVKFTIDFDEGGRVTAITYTPFPAEHKDELLERVRDVCQSFGKSLTGELVNVVVGFKNPNRN